MKKKHLGGDFDEFLQAEGLLEGAQSVAVKRVIAQDEEAELVEFPAESRNIRNTRRDFEGSQFFP